MSGDAPGDSSIRPGRPDDRDWILALAPRLHEFGPPPFRPRPAMSTDYFTGEAHGHVSDIVVDPQQEGRGVGRALLAAAEDWARSRGYRLISLNVFGDNDRARRLYEAVGYGTDTVKMVKEIG